MKIVTAIEMVNHSKSRVYVNDEIAFVLYKGDLSKYHIRLNFDIDDETYEDIILMCEKRAKLRCLKLLEQKDYTIKQLRDKLIRSGYTDTITDCAIQYVESYGYLNDYRYAVSYIEEKTRKYSRFEVRMKLLQKGLNSSIIEEAFMYLNEEGRLSQDTEAISILLKKKHYSILSEQEDVQKLTNYLLQKGFKMSDIHDAMKNFREEE